MGTIYLTGCMGAGKTSVGLALRDALGRAFVDLDAQLLAETGFTAAELIEEAGELAMRDAEAAVLTRVARPDERVIALGGGSLERPESLQRVLGSGDLVYLAADAETLAARATADRGTVRPLLRGDATAKMRHLLQRRGATYERAAVRVDTSALAVQAVAERVGRAVGAVPLGADAASQGERVAAQAALPRTRVDLGERAYDILHARAARSLLGAAIRARFPGIARALVLSDDAVWPRYGAEAMASLRAHGIEGVPIVVAAGEGAKSLDVLGHVYDDALAAGLDRRTPLVALGGGVVGDLGGFAAATLLRGLPFVQVPTTLLSLVDSSVGGKTGINHSVGKNLVGAFHQPSLVFADVSYLATLPSRELRAGLAEVVKYGVIADEGFFAWMEREADALRAGDDGALEVAVRRSCELKARYVERDERETSGERAELNFGHTFGHALERLHGYGTLRHGEAVAVGMCMAARVAALLGIASSDVGARIEALLSRLGLPTAAEWEGEALARAMARDKKARATDVEFILPLAIGRVRRERHEPGRIVRLLRGGS